MTVTKSLSIVALATLPLVLMTSTLFISGGEPPILPTDIPEVPATVVAIRGRVIEALEKGKAELETVVDADPAGFLGTADGPAATKPPYSTATVLVEAAAATMSDDLSRVTRALATLAEDSLASAVLEPEVASVRQRLERHATWLRNRKAVAEALRTATESLRTAASIPDASKAVQVLDDLRQRLPKVVAMDAALSEPGDALTTEEADEAGRLRQWAAYRAEFLSLKSRHSARGESEPADLNALVEDWGRFIGTFQAPKSPDQDDYVSEAKRLRTDARLDFLRKTAFSKETPADLAPAVLEWLTESKSGDDGQAVDTERRDQVEKLLKTWLSEHLPAAPVPPNGLEDMEEGVIDAGPAGKRLLAIFEEVPEQPRRYRWWYTQDQRNSLPLGEDSGFLKEPPGTPKCCDWASRYEDARNAYVRTFMAEGGRFARECRELADACRTHMQLPSFQREKDVMADVSEWAKLFLDAADKADAFQKACRDSGLEARLRQQSP